MMQNTDDFFEETKERLEILNRATVNKEINVRITKAAIRIFKDYFASIVNELLVKASDEGDSKEFTTNMMMTVESQYVLVLNALTFMNIFESNDKGPSFVIDKLEAKVVIDKIRNIKPEKLLQDILRIVELDSFNELFG